MVADSLHMQHHETQRAYGSLFGWTFAVPFPLGSIATIALTFTFLLSTIGALFLLRYTYSFLRLFLELTIIPGTNIQEYKSRTGSTWALVTGATEGIGLEFARQLAAKKYNVIILGRRAAVLEEIATGLRSKYHVEVKIVTVDVSKPDARTKAFSQIQAMAKELDIGVLVNNVAASHEMPVAFAETDAEEIENILQTNLLWTLHLARVILPTMIMRKPKSLILNIGSLNGRIPPPLTAAYGCTKGGLQIWSRALAEEVKQQGVLVYMVLPAFVVSNMSKIRRTSLLVPSAASWVNSTLASIGLPRGAQGRPHEMTPYWTHALLDYATGLFGYFSEVAAIKVIAYMHRDIRKRALRKKARESGKGKGKVE